MRPADTRGEGRRGGLVVAVGRSPRRLGEWVSVPRTPSRHATCRYSWTRPPRRSRRSGRTVASEGGGVRPAGGADRACGDVVPRAPTGSGRAATCRLRRARVRPRGAAVPTRSLAGRLLTGALTRDVGAARRGARLHAPDRGRGGAGRPTLRAVRHGVSLAGGLALLAQVARRWGADLRS